MQSLYLCPDTVGASHAGNQAHGTLERVEKDREKEERFGGRHEDGQRMDVNGLHPRGRVSVGKELPE